MAASVDAKTFAMLAGASPSDRGNTCAERVGEQGTAGPFSLLYESEIKRSRDRVDEVPASFRGITGDRHGNREHLRLDSGSPESARKHSVPGTDRPGAEPEKEVRDREKLSDILGWRSLGRNVDEVVMPRPEAEPEEQARDQEKLSDILDRGSFGGNVDAVVIPRPGEFLLPGSGKKLQELSELVRRGFPAAFTEGSQGRTTATIDVSKGPTPERILSVSHRGDSGFRQPAVNLGGETPHRGVQQGMNSHGLAVSAFYGLSRAEGEGLRSLAAIQQGFKGISPGKAETGKGFLLSVPRSDSAAEAFRGLSRHNPVQAISRPGGISADSLIATGRGILSGDSRLFRAPVVAGINEGSSGSRESTSGLETHRVSTVVSRSESNLSVYPETKIAATGDKKSQPLSLPDRGFPGGTDSRSFPISPGGEYQSEKARGSTERSGSNLRGETVKNTVNALQSREAAGSHRFSQTHLPATERHSGAEYAGQERPVSASTSPVSAIPEGDRIRPVSGEDRASAERSVNSPGADLKGQGDAKGKTETGAPVSDKNGSGSAGRIGEPGSYEKQADRTVVTASHEKDAVGRQNTETPQWSRDDRGIIQASAISRGARAANIPESPRAEASARLPLETRLFSEHLTSVATSLGKSGFHRVKIQLTPPHLGSLDMEVIIRDKTVRVLFRVDSIEAGRFLQAGTEQLKASLQGQGLNVESFSVTQRDQQGSAFQQNFGQEGFMSDGEEARKGDNKDGDLEDSAESGSRLSTGEDGEGDSGRINFFA